MKIFDMLVGQGWLLFLLEASKREGTPVVSMQTLHRLIYLANVLSPMFDLSMPNSYTLKYKRGPYFPEAQWDIEVLAAKKLIAPKNVRPFEDDFGYWLEADYEITKKGIELVDKLIKHQSFKKNAIFLREFMRAISSFEAEYIVNTCEADIHYYFASDDEAVDVAYPNSNYTKDVVIQMFPNNRPVAAREGIHRYISYLYKFGRKVSGES
jgi:hypothetical protein